jgi:hypothetical protein
MPYSRKRYWLTLGAALAVALTVMLVSTLRPLPALMAMPVVAVCGGLGFLAYFSLDEIQRQNEIRAWYYGGLLAILFGFAPFVLLMSNALLEAMASRIAPDGPRAPTIYFGLGAGVVLGMQVMGHLIAHAIFKVSGRARR